MVPEYIFVPSLVHENCRWLFIREWVKIEACREKQKLFHSIKLGDISVC
jgi:hypothetical protein